MKKLKLKIQDLENPSILTHREIKNIMGGDAGGSGGFGWTCDCIRWDGGTDPFSGLSYPEMEMRKALCEIDSAYREVNCYE